MLRIALQAGVRQTCAGPQAELLQGRRLDVIQNRGVLLTDVVRTSRGDLVSFRLLATDFLIASTPRNEEVIREEGKPPIGISAEYEVCAPSLGRSLVAMNIIFLPDSEELFYLDHWVEM